jgi:hypothetical protein
MTCLVCSDFYSHRNTETLFSGTREIRQKFAQWTCNEPDIRTHTHCICNEGDINNGHHVGNRSCIQCLSLQMWGGLFWRACLCYVQWGTHRAYSSNPRTLPVPSVLRETNWEINQVCWFLLHVLNLVSSEVVEREMRNEEAYSGYESCWGTIHWTELVPYRSFV